MKYRKFSCIREDVYLNDFRFTNSVDNSYLPWAIPVQQGQMSRSTTCNMKYNPFLQVVDIKEHPICIKLHTILWLWNDMLSSSIDTSRLDSNFSTST